MNKTQLDQLYNKIKHADGDFEYESDASILACYVLELIDLLRASLPEPEPTIEFRGVTIRKYTSNSGNTTWKLYDDNNNILYLRQSQRELYEAAGIWSVMNQMPFEINLNCNIVLNCIQDGDFLKPVEVVSYHWDDYTVEGETPNDPELPEHTFLDFPPEIAGKSDSFASFIDTVKNGNFLILDTETTDMYGSICEIAIIDQDGNVLLDKLVNPGVLIKPGAQAVHGITNEMIANAESWETIRPHVIRLLKNRNLIIYNKSYDIPRLNNTDITSGVNKIAGWREDFFLDIPLSIHCAMESYAEHHGNWNDYHGSYKWVKLTEAAAIENVIADGKPHRALADCQLTLGICRALANKY